MEALNCQGSKPEKEKHCTSRFCPSWYAGSWSGVRCTSGGICLFSPQIYCSVVLVVEVVHRKEGLSADIQAVNNRAG